MSMGLRDAAVSAAAALLYKAGQRKNRSGCTLLEEAVQRFAQTDPVRARSPSFDGLCARTLAWSISKFLRLYGIDPRYVQASMRSRATATAFFNLARTIASEGIRKPLSLCAPISVVWSLSRRCNLRCVHCYQDAGAISEDEMSLGEQLDVVDQLAEIGVALVVLSGGEPLLNRHIFTLIERIAGRGMAIALDSNGILIDEAMAVRLKDARVKSVEISIDSTSPENHDEFRGVRGAFDRAREAVANCANQGIFTTVATTVTRRNFGEITELANLAKIWGARRIAIFDLIPEGRGVDINDEALSDQQRVDLMEFAIAKSRSGDIEVVVELPQLTPYVGIHGTSREWHGSCEIDAFSVEKFAVTSYFNMSSYGAVYRTIAPYLGGCPAGRFYCNVQPNGDVTPCMFMPTYPVAGNLRFQSFREVWTDSTVFRRLRERKTIKGKCRSCAFLQLCGGCRAKAASYFGDYLQEDPDCPLRA